MSRLILHLCADLGSDSYPYRFDPLYKVVTVGKDPGVENYRVVEPVHGVMANPVCTEFSTAKGFHKKTADPSTELLMACLRVIDEAKPVWWFVENPFNGTMKDIMGIPDFVYQPWEFGSPWTKKTALWGKFNPPEKLYTNWDDVPKNDKLYVRPKRKKPSLAFLHKSAIHDIPEFEPFVKLVDSDNAFRSLCSQGFAEAFKKANP